MRNERFPSCGGTIPLRFILERFKAGDSLVARATSNSNPTTKGCVEIFEMAEQEVLFDQS